MNKIKHIIPLGLACALTISAVVPAFADEQAQPPGYDDGIDHVRTWQGTWPNCTVHFVGGRVIYEDTYEFETGCYSTLGLVSTNLDGSDKKVILMDNNGENASDEEVALGDWLYFRYNYDNLARIKNDGSSFEIVHSFPPGEFHLSGTEENRLHFNKGRGDSSIWCYLTADDPTPVEGVKLRSLGTFSTKHQCYYKFPIRERLIQVYDPDGNLVKNIEIPRSQLTGNLYDAKIIGFIDDFLIASFSEDLNVTGWASFTQAKSRQKVAAIDLNTGNCQLLPDDIGGSLIVSRNWIYHYVSDGSERSGLNRMDLNGNNELVVPSQIPAKIYAAYGGYIYCQDSSRPPYIVRIYKTQ